MIHESSINFDLILDNFGECAMVCIFNIRDIRDIDQIFCIFCNSANISYFSLQILGSSVEKFKICIENFKTWLLKVPAQEIKLYCQTFEPEFLG